MKKGGADCHCHTHYSDGTFTPAEVMERARDRGLEAIAITDHDCVDGLAQAEEASRITGVELIPGIEISAYGDGSEIHILGLFIDWRSPELNRVLDARRAARIKRTHGMVERLHEAGVDIHADELIQWAGKGVVGRLHVARFLVEKGICATTTEAFQRFLGDGGRCHIPNEGFPSADAIRTIRAAGGIAVMAHPHLSKKDDMISSLKNMGMRGIEAYHTGHPPDVAARYERIAQEQGLVVSGGSDCHGTAKGKPLIGLIRISMERLQTLKECCG